MANELVVVGAGMSGGDHLTFQTAQEIAQSDCVFHLMTGARAIQTVAQLNPNTFDLTSMYRENDLDLEVYGRIASYLIAQALHFRKVTLIVMGHPSIYVAPTFLLLEHGPRYGIDVRVLPAVSSIDVILSGLRFDIANSGLQILDANRLLTYGLLPQTNVPLLLFQLGCFGSGYITRQQQNSVDRLARLSEYLLQFYPRSHRVQLVECDMGPPHKPFCFELELSALRSHGHLVNYNSTLLVPPSQALIIQDKAFFEQLVDPNAVDRVLQRRAEDGASI
jgi:hypothetical protein